VGVKGIDVRQDLDDVDLSSTTMTAPEPDIEPAAMGPSKSSGMSSIAQSKGSPLTSACR
jgi:hypothetical protein